MRPSESVSLLGESSVVTLTLSTGVRVDPGGVAASIPSSPVLAGIESSRPGRRPARRCPARPRRSLAACPAGAYPARMAEPPTMPSAAFPRSVGSPTLAGMFRQPGWLFLIPPAPSRGEGDIAAVRRGGGRRVRCYLMPDGKARRLRRRGMLELSGDAVVWRPGRGVRAAKRQVEAADVTVVRGNRLFSVVRCVTPTGVLSLQVPTADVPLVTWRLGCGGEVAG